jgi:hypothetical protein
MESKGSTHVWMWVFVDGLAEAGYVMGEGVSPDSQPSKTRSTRGPRHETDQRYVRRLGRCKHAKTEIHVTHKNKRFELYYPWLSISKPITTQGTPSTHTSIFVHSPASRLALSPCVHDAVAMASTRLRSACPCPCR